MYVEKVPVKPMNLQWKIFSYGLRCHWLTFIRGGGVKTIGPWWLNSRVNFENPIKILNNKPRRWRGLGWGVYIFYLFFTYFVQMKSKILIYSIRLLICESVGPWFFFSIKINSSLYCYNRLNFFLLVFVNWLIDSVWSLV